MRSFELRRRSFAAHGFGETLRLEHRVDTERDDVYGSLKVTSEEVQEIELVGVLQPVSDAIRGQLNMGPYDSLLYFFVNPTAPISTDDVIYKASEIIIADIAEVPYTVGERISEVISIDNPDNYDVIIDRQRGIIDIKNAVSVVNPVTITSKLNKFVVRRIDKAPMYKKLTLEEVR